MRDWSAFSLCTARRYRRRPQDTQEAKQVRLLCIALRGLFTVRFAAPSPVAPLFVHRLFARLLFHDVARLFVAR